MKDSASLSWNEDGMASEQAMALNRLVAGALVMVLVLCVVPSDKMPTLLSFMPLVAYIVASLVILMDVRRGRPPPFHAGRWQWPWMLPPCRSSCTRQRRLCGPVSRLPLDHFRQRVPLRQPLPVRRFRSLHRRFQRRHRHDTVLAGDAWTLRRADRGTDRAPRVCLRADRSGAGRPAKSRGRQPREDVVPGERQPRAADAAERDHRTRELLSTTALNAEQASMLSTISISRRRNSG